MVKREYERWLQHPNVDSSYKTILENMDETTKNDSFYKNLTFGTAGMRGILGPGTNRMNLHTLRKANMGFIRFLLQEDKDAKKRGIAIGYDNRHMSYAFAMDSAKLLAMYGIRTYVFDALRPTPQLSFAVRYYRCFGGIMITASHNPKEYNGYKLYDENGCQLIPETAQKVIHYVEAIEDELAIQVQPTKEQLELITMIGKEVDEAYYKEVLAMQFYPEGKKDYVKVVFSPEHGTGSVPIQEILHRAGYHVIPVHEQCHPDPDFSHTASANPEEELAYELGIEYAKKENADLVLVCDPDADRMGVAVKHNQNYIILTGNQCGAILMEYIFSQMVKKEQLPGKPIMFNTVVTSDLGEKVAQKYGVVCEKTLTGFKFIGDKIAKYEQKEEYQYVFGYEESYGYLIKPFVRDKDAPQACLMLVEAANYYKQQGKDLIDILHELYEHVGYYQDTAVSISFAGQEGAEKMNTLLQKLRDQPLQEIAGISVSCIEDYNISQRFEGRMTSDIIGIPKANVLKYYLCDGSWIAVRPSGTEPKCKLYYCVKGKSEEEAREKTNCLQEAMAHHVL